MTRVTGEDIQVEATFQLSRVSTGEFLLSITDNTSRTLIGRFQIESELMGQLIATQPTPGTGTVYRGPIGYALETRSVPKSSDIDAEETDGWRAQRDYIRNSHYNYVPLNRWVHPETGEVWM